MDLATRSKPLKHLEVDIFGGKTFQYIGMFQKLLDLVLVNSGRVLIDPTATHEDRDVVPEMVRVKSVKDLAEGQLSGSSVTTTPTRLLIRGLPMMQPVVTSAKLSPEEVDEKAALVEELMPPFYRSPSNSISETRSS